MRLKKKEELFKERKETDLNTDFRNKLIQGDCLSACAYLKDKNIKIDLVYIDPPFASGANYAKKIYLRNGGKETIEAEDNTIGEEIMYGDIWQKEDYLNWLYERLLVIRDVMSETASIYVHLDWHIGHYVKILMDEIFGGENFRNEIIWSYRRWTAPSKNFQSMHDTIYYYRKNEEKVFNSVYVKPSNEEKGVKENYKRDESGKLFRWQSFNGKRYKIYRNEKGVPIGDVWDISFVHPSGYERVDYATQKPEKLLERIIKASSDKGMIVADFFSGSGTTAKVANDLGRKFIACDIGINAIQTTRDRLVKSGVNFDILKIKDGLRLFRNPTQTKELIFSIIDGFKSSQDLDLGLFWDGGIAQTKGTYTPIKFSGIQELLTKELLDIFLEEIYKLEDTTDQANKIMIVYAHKEDDIDEKYLKKTLPKTQMQIELKSLDELLNQKKDALFIPDNAIITMHKDGKEYKVEIKKFYSSYLYKKIEDYNIKKTKQETLEQDLSKAIKISDTGLELIESIQFDTTLDKIWKSNGDLEDKAGIKDKIKGSYLLDTDKFKIKIRNIAGDESIIDSEDINK